MGFCAFSEDPHGILCIFGSFSCDFVHFWKFLVGFCAFLEVPRWILYIYGSSTWDCVYLGVPRGIVYILEVPPGILCPKMHKIQRGTSKNAQNPTRNFQKCTKSQEKLPNMHKIPRGSSENAQNLIMNFQNSHNPTRNF
jgi:hypothetical protein